MAATKPIIRFGIFDTTARDDAEFSATGKAAFTTETILKEVAYSTVGYATLELNNWLLNGTQPLPPSNIATGRWSMLSSELSDANGVLVTPLVININFDNPHTSAGITLRGDVYNDLWASEVTITWLGEFGEPLAEVVFTPDAPKYFANYLVENYYGLTIRATKTNRPLSRAAISQLQFGLEYLFSGEELIEASTITEINPVSECLFIGQCNFTILDRAKAFGVLSSESVLEALQAGQKIYVSYELLPDKPIKVTPANAAMIEESFAAPDGGTYYITFDIDVTTGKLYATVPDNYVGPEFELDAATGQLLMSLPSGYMGPQFVLDEDTGYIMAAVTLTRRVGEYYLDDWTSQDGVKVQFKCIDIIGVMSKRDCTGGMFNNAPLSGVLDDLFSAFDVSFEIDDTLSATTLTGWIPITDYRTALQYICFAAGAVATVTPQNTIRIAPLKEEILSTFDRDRKFVGAVLERRKEITDVQVTAHNYAAETGEKLKIVEQVYPVGQWVIYFDKPMTDYEITGGTLATQHANVITIEVATEGLVTVLAHEYRDEMVVTRVQRQTPLAGGARTYLQADKCTLVSPTNAAYVAQLLYDYYAMSRRTEYRAVLQNENIGEYTRVYTTPQTAIVGPITKMVVNLIGMVTTFSVVGDITNLLSSDSLQQSKMLYEGVRTVI